MALPAAATQKFPQSIRRSSEMLVERIGPKRLALANLHDAIVADAHSASERRHADGVFRVLLREAA